jgi:hypothetical protein
MQTKKYAAEYKAKTVASCDQRARRGGCGRMTRYM